MENTKFGWYSEKQRLVVGYAYCITVESAQVTVTMVTDTIAHEAGFDDLKFVGRIARITKSYFFTDTTEPVASAKIEEPALVTPPPRALCYGCYGGDPVHSCGIPTKPRWTEQTAFGRPNYSYDTGPTLRGDLPPDRTPRLGNPGRNCTNCGAPNAVYLFEVKGEIIHHCAACCRLRQNGRL